MRNFLNETFSIGFLGGQTHNKDCLHARGHGQSGQHTRHHSRLHEESRRERGSAAGVPHNQRTSSRTSFEKFVTSVEFQCLPDSEEIRKTFNKTIEAYLTYMGTVLPDIAQQKFVFFDDLIKWVTEAMRQQRLTLFTWN